MMQRIGGRKFALGMTYVVGCCVLIGMAIWTREAAIVASVAGACVSLAPGVGVIVWGNVQEHKTKNGG